MLDKSILAQFSGTENYYRYQGIMRFPLVYTDGVNYVLKNGGGGAYWLADAIVSHQINPKIKNNARLQEMQIWRLEVKGNSAILTCKADSGCTPAVTQKIEYTDFDFSIDLWMEPSGDEKGNKFWVLYLPSEH